MIRKITQDTVPTNVMLQIVLYTYLTYSRYILQSISWKAVREVRQVLRARQCFISGFKFKTRGIKLKRRVFQLYLVPQILVRRFIAFSSKSVYCRFRPMNNLLDKKSTTYQEEFFWRLSSTILSEYSNRGRNETVLNISTHLVTIKTEKIPRKIIYSPFLVVNVTLKTKKRSSSTYLPSWYLMEPNVDKFSFRYGQKYKAHIWLRQGFFHGSWELKQGLGCSFLESRILWHPAYGFNTGTLPAALYFSLNMGSLWKSVSKTRLQAKGSFETTKIQMADPNPAKIMVFDNTGLWSFVPGQPQAVPTYMLMSQIISGGIGNSIG